MTSLKNIFTYGKINIKHSFKSYSTYKLASFLNSFTKTILIVAQFFLWKAIYLNSSSIRGYSFQDMILYITFSSILGSLYPHNVSQKLGMEVKSGDIVYLLLKPVKMELQYFFESIGELAYKVVFQSLPIFLVSTIFLGVKINIQARELILFLIFFVLSYLFVFVLELNIGMLSYYTNSLWGINNFKSSIISILSGKFLPLKFYPPKIQKIIAFSPFSVMLYLPLNILMGKPIGNIGAYFYSIFGAIIILAGIYIKLSNYMIKKLMISGG